MAKTEYYKNKQKLYIAYFGVLIIMLILSYFAMPVVFEKTECTKELIKASCGEAKFMRYLTLLSIPAINILVLILMAVIPVTKMKKMH